VWRRIAMAIGAAVVGVGIVVASQPLWVFGVLAWAFPGILWRVRTTQPLVALSFDDGPSPEHTPAVLRILAKHGARATFFLIGERAVDQADLVASMRAAGHEVGNHYFTIHSTMRASDDQFRANLMRTERALGMAGPVKLFRPPGGWIRGSQIAIARSCGYRVVLGSAYPYDPSHPPPAYIRYLVNKNLAPGVIVILHDGIPDPSRMIAALEPILAAGERRGFRFVPIGTLLEAADE
jgi:peptidoglycan-N-acetylglucosamine deacetylase